VYARDKKGTWFRADIPSATSSAQTSKPSGSAFTEARLGLSFSKASRSSSGYAAVPVSVAATAAATAAVGAEASSAR
jgi:hypothetical protein